jgi:hypothetical protein
MRWIGCTGLVPCLTSQGTPRAVLEALQLLTALDRGAADQAGPDDSASIISSAPGQIITGPETGRWRNRALNVRRAMTAVIPGGLLGRGEERPGKAAAAASAAEKASPGRGGAPTPAHGVAGPCSGCVTRRWARDQTTTGPQEGGGPGASGRQGSRGGCGRVRVRPLPPRWGAQGRPAAGTRCLLLLGHVLLGPRPARLVLATCSQAIVPTAFVLTAIVPQASLALLLPDWFL